MKNSLTHFWIWQKKRNELPVNDDAQQDWEQMQKILDQQMPFNGIVKKKSSSKKLKIIPAIFFSMSAAAMTYVFTYVITVKKHGAPGQTHVERQHPIFKSDGIIRDSAALTANGKDSLYKADSISPGQQQIIVQLKQRFNGISPLNTTANHSGAFQRNASYFDSIKKIAAGRPTGSGSISNQIGLPGTVKLQSASVNNAKNAPQPYSLAGTKSKSSLSTLFQNLNPGQNNQENLSQKVLADNSNGNTSIIPLIPKPIINIEDYIFKPGTMVRFDSKLPKNTRAVKLLSIRNIDKNKKERLVKNVRTIKRFPKASNPFTLDWGILTGVNSAGSFTPKAQNSNFYGAAPVDFFVGVFAAYNLSAKWAINSQIKILSPQIVSYDYAHLDDGMLGSPELQINSNGKIYSLEVPLQLSYRINNFLSVLAGPSISFPVNHTGITNKLITNGLKKDSAYFSALSDTLNATKYLPKVNIGLSGGLNFKYKRLIIGAMWNQSLTGYQIKSAFGTYKTKPGTFQFTLGWQLDKIKLKK